MVARAAAATPEEIMALHGRVTVRDPVTLEPPASRRAFDPTLGEPEATVDGVTVRAGRPGDPAPGARCRPARAACSTAARRRSSGSWSTSSGKVHLGVTIDGDPGQELLRETGRLLYFFPPEVEVIET